MDRFYLNVSYGFNGVGTGRTGGIHELFINNLRNMGVDDMK
jgi:hypothetical protein